MNDRQQKFVELVFAGRPAGRAYEEAGYRTRGAAADTGASRLLASNAEIKSYLAKMRAAAESKAVWGQSEKMDMLKRIATKQEHTEPRVSIAAIAELSKMDGGYEPERHELEIIVTIGGARTVE
jgi:phage terminase small subunit